MKLKIKPGQERMGFQAFLHVLYRFIPFLVPVWDKLLLRIIIGLCRSFLTVAMIMITAKIIDDGLLAKNPEMFWYWVKINLGIITVWLFTYIIWLIMVHYVKLKMEIKLKTIIHNHVQSLSIRFHQSRPVGEHMWRIQGDTKDALTLVCDFAPGIIELFWSVLSATGLIMLVNPITGLCIAVFTIIQFFYLHFGASYLRRLSLKNYKAMQNLTAVLQENLSAFPTSKALSRENHEKIRYYKALIKRLRTAIRYSIFNIGWGTGNSFIVSWNQYISYMLVCGILVIRGDMTLGEYVTMGQAIGWLTGPIQWLMWHIEYARITAVPAERMLDTLEIRPEIIISPNAKPIQKPKGEITFENVSFRYLPDSPEVISNLSFSVSPGKKVAIVGPSGAGKSTIFNLVMRYYDPTAGRVLIDGYDLCTLSLSSYRDQTAIVLQDTFLFSATLRDNILYGNPNATKKQLDNAIRMAGVDTIIDELPEGMDTLLTEDGNLSGGQRQKIAMARAIIRDPKFLFLDEATSALDPITERSIIKHLQTIEQGRTRIFVAHSIDSILDADEIIVLDKGYLRQQGTHENLVNQPGLYQKMWKTGNNDTRNKQAIS